MEGAVSDQVAGFSRDITLHCLLLASPAQTLSSVQQTGFSAVSWFVRHAEGRLIVSSYVSGSSALHVSGLSPYYIRDWIV